MTHVTFIKFIKSHLTPPLGRYDICHVYILVLNVLCVYVCKQSFITVTGPVPANQPVSGGEATDRCKSFRRKMADCPS